MEFDQLLNEAWSDHAADPAGVLARLSEQGPALAGEPAQLRSLAGLVVHVAGEHLGRYPDGVALLERLAELPVADAATQAALGRSCATLLWASGDELAAESALAKHLDPDRPAASSRVRMLAVAASALAGQGQTVRAITTFEAAVSAADYGPSADDPAARSLAITGNNLACALEEKSGRSPAEAELMVSAAVAARRWWEVAGTPNNVMLAEARLAFSHLEAGATEVALLHARRSLAMAEASDSPPGERLTPRLALVQCLAAGADVEARTQFEALQADLAEVSDEVRGWYTESVAKAEAALPSRAPRAAVP